MADLERDVNRVSFACCPSSCHTLTSGQVIRSTSRKHKVDWSEEELCVYYSDLYKENFLKLDDGRVCIVDFQHAGVIPRSLMEMALRESNDAALEKEVKSRVPDLDRVTLSNMQVLDIARYMYQIGVRDYL